MHSSTNRFFKNWKSRKELLGGRGATCVFRAPSRRLEIFVSIFRLFFFTSWIFVLYTIRTVITSRASPSG
eukprot:5861434-Pyramimonas_sp.AAC.1